MNSEWLNHATVKTRRNAMLGVFGVLILQAAFSANSFFSDLYPTRMATTLLSKEIDRLKIDRLATYKTHPLRANMVDSLNPQLLSRLHFTAINNVAQVKDGYILIPPVTGDSIYRAMTSDYTDYDQDLILNELFKNGRIKEFAVASFKTLASSRIWIQEEEIFTNRSLILDHFVDGNPDKTKVWLLDARKLSQNLTSLMPPADTLQLIKYRARNIGLKNKVLMYKGRHFSLPDTTTLAKMPVRAFKVGNPSDGLKAYVYRLDEIQPVWIPLDSQHFSSVTLDAQDISTQPGDSTLTFKFDPPLKLPAGPYYVVIYRTGALDDQNFYRVILDDKKPDEYQQALRNILPYLQFVKGE